MEREILVIKIPFIEKNCKCSMNIRNNENIFEIIFPFYYFIILTRGRKREGDRNSNKVDGPTNHYGPVSNMLHLELLLRAFVVHMMINYSAQRYDKFDATKLYAINILTR